MSGTYIVIAFFLIIVLLVILVSKVKIHAVMSLLLVTILLGILIGTPISKIPETINTGFGNTCASVALVIFLGSLLGEILGETGGAVKITNTLISLFGKKKVLWAVGASSLLMGIPIFPDTIGLLLIPICSNLAISTGISMSAFAAIIGAGIVSSSLVPPTPGPVAAAAFLGLSLGEVIPWGIVVSIPGLIALGLFARTRKADIAPKEEFLHGLSMDESQIPNFARSVTPILLPIVLIVCNTVIGVLCPGTLLAELFSFVGEPLSALLIGVFAAVLLTVKEWWKNEDVKGPWIEKALVGAAGPIFITALGGSLAVFIREAGVAEMIAQMVVEAKISGIFVPMIISIIIRIITGSNTLALMTTAALTEPMLATLGVSKLAAFLAMGAGGIIFSHANSSGFWLVSGMCNLDFKEALKSIGGGTAISGAASCVTVLVLYFAGII